ncbi:ribonuclease TUDOR 2-like [Phragmites australis]|uniref:ribonuclease TUDOR 2-like n=1 Tax=Phragmites australis TaxID=29695 RepID=UPI002D786FFA|nr:ribonuclease TUDOR 2-like [Phragmites australis]
MEEADEGLMSNHFGISSLEREGLTVPDLKGVACGLRVDDLGRAASAMAASGWFRGKVKAVPSGDTLVIMGSGNPETIPPEKSITLSSIIAPRLARRFGTDEPFAWESREFLRKLCIGQDVTFRVDYMLPATGREFGTVYLGDQNIACLVVANGFANVKQQGQKANDNPYVAELVRLEDTAKQHGLGRWTKEPNDPIRNLPTSSIGEADAKDFVAKNKGKALEAIVEQVRDGSTLCVYLIPSFDFVHVHVAGVQAPSMGRQPFIPSRVAQTEDGGDDDVNRKAFAETQASMTAVQKLVASPAICSEIPPDPFGREAKHFTETRVLNREVRIVLEGTSFNNIFGSVYYSDGNTAKDLALELVENGFAKYMEWGANMLGPETKTKLKNADLEAKKKQLRIWTGFKPPATNTRPIQNQKFTGKVIEVVNGYCIIVADDAAPYGRASAERRVNLSSIRPPKVADPSGENKTLEHFARVAKEFLRTRLIGKEVNVSMEYSRRINIADGQVVAHKINSADTRVLDYGSVFLPSQVEGVGSNSSSSSGNQLGVNVAELLLSRGFADVTRHRDYEERSHHYDALLAAYSRAEKARKGYHSKKDHPVTHMNDLTTAPAKKARDFLHLLQQNRRHSAVVDYIFSGHRFKLTIPKENSIIAFSFSGVRCPGKNEPYSDDAISLMRKRILQRDVEIEIEAVDKTGTFLGSLWESKTNMASVLLEAGLAKLSSFGLSRTPDAQTLLRVEQSAKHKKLKVWENYNEAEVIPQRSMTGQKEKETLKVIVTEVLDGGKFYVQIVGDRRLASIQEQLASLKFNDAPFNPAKGDMVLAQFSLDNSWNRAMIVSECQGAAEPEFIVFYIDYGNQEAVPYSHLRPADQFTSLVPPLAKLCSLAFITVPSLKDDLGEQAAGYLSRLLLDNEKEFKAIVEERGTAGAKLEGQGTGEVFIVTLVDEDVESSINAAMLERGFAQIERKRWDSWERRAAVKNLEEFQEHARKKHRGVWRLRDVSETAEEEKALGVDDDEDPLAPAQAPPPSKGFDLIKFIAFKSSEDPEAPGSP